jgi:hypothetical protein
MRDTFERLIYSFYRNFKIKVLKYIYMYYFSDNFFFLTIVIS